MDVTGPSASHSESLAGRWLCLAGAALGALGLLGNVVGLNLLTTIVPGQPAMTPNTGLGLLLIGVAGALRQQADPGRARAALAAAAAIVVLVMGGATLAEYALGSDLDIDQVIISTRAGPYPGRPSPPTAFALTFLAASLLLFDVRPNARARPSEWLALSAGLIAFTALVGLLFGAGPLYRLTHAPVIGVSLPTGVGLLVISIGFLLGRPASGVMGIATSPGPGGVLLRRLVVPATLTPVLVAFLVTRFAAALGLQELPVVIAMLASMLSAVILLLLVVAAAPLNRTHEDLESSRMRTTSLVEQAPDGIFVADLQGRYTDVNDAGCRMLGYARHEIIGKRIVDLIPPADSDRLMLARTRLLAGSTDFAEWSLRRKDGSYVPVEVSAKILPDGRWQGFVRDISHRKQLENDLRLSEAKSTGILSVSSDAIISIDERQRITLFNDGAQKMFGYSQAEMIGASLDLLIPVRLRDTHGRHVERFSASSSGARKMGTREVAIVGLRKNGEEFPADAAISKLDVGGRQVLTVVMRDITDQKRIENEQRFLADVGRVLATTLDYDETISRIAETAVRGLADFCIIDLVDEMGDVRRLRVVSRDPSNAGACGVLERVSPHHKPASIVASALESQEAVLIGRLSPANAEALSCGDDHRQAFAAIDLQSVMVVPLVAHGTLLGAITFLSASASPPFGEGDLYLAHELAQRAALAVDNARLYRAAQRAVQVRDDILGIVAHDLRNPLSMIVIEARLLRRSGSGPERRSVESAESIQRAANRMNRIIQDLLDVTRMEAGQLSVEPRRLPTSAVIVEAVDLQRALADAASLALRVELPQNLPDVRADGHRLLQVFENLIGNAIKFTPAGGCITVGGVARDADVLFWIRDTGPGITAEDQAHLFDRFWQGARESRRGTGLGLPIVKGIVEAHGGLVWVESAETRGSTFFFTIPAADRVERVPGDLASSA